MQHPSDAEPAGNISLGITVEQAFHPVKISPCSADVVGGDDANMLGKHILLHPPAVILRKSIPEELAPIVGIGTFGSETPFEPPVRIPLEIT